MEATQRKHRARKLAEVCLVPLFARLFPFPRWVLRSPPHTFRVSPQRPQKSQPGMFHDETELNLDNQGGRFLNLTIPHFPRLSTVLSLCLGGHSWSATASSGIPVTGRVQDSTRVLGLVSELGKSPGVIEHHRFNGRFVDEFTLKTLACSVSCTFRQPSLGLEGVPRNNLLW